MRKISKLAALPEADQRRILDLCENNPYDHVAILLALPRDQGGLELQTSASARSPNSASCSNSKKIRHPP